jgi:hypothetical protein
MNTRFYKEGFQSSPPPPSPTSPNFQLVSLGGTPTIQGNSVTFKSGDQVTSRASYNFKTDAIYFECTPPVLPPVPDPEVPYVERIFIGFRDIYFILSPDGLLVPDDDYSVWRQANPDKSFSYQKGDVIAIYWDKSSVKYLLNGAIIATNSVFDNPNRVPSSDELFLSLQTQGGEFLDTITVPSINIYVVDTPAAPAVATSAVSTPADTTAADTTTKPSDMPLGTKILIGIIVIGGFFAVIKFLVGGGSSQPTITTLQGGFRMVKHYMKRIRR